jgi:F-type H+-transporting ATPase subunit b
MQLIIQQLEMFLLSSIPTILLFTVLVLAYQFLVQGPLSTTLKERYDRTAGAQEKAQQAIAQAEELAGEYADKLRQARGEVFKAREARIKQWNAEREAALDAVRKTAGQKVSKAKTALEAEAAQARLAIQASAGDLARQVVRAVLPVAAGGSR